MDTIDVKESSIKKVFSKVNWLGVGVDTNAWAYEGTYAHTSLDFY